ncbi:response regulator transcription factor [Flavobacterium salilacus subsp. salilacus]|uniref:LytR/AlgR family response regulator transcription factor n=1 Tax=Flavobacterium TaxID=237 RepID=UPI00107554E6|nr:MULTISPECIES: LytTR family DNA-binding domain-containing protein [Flavobacterium]KAF2516848.1 response regulator transcription factor [Flavobacterium salilacus subsp. salilacus]MBE1615793.1 response regulator transcription factor [Flavobacterium sp. SaA2.13]NDI99823.1 response regulator transcription factor [Flavobacterium salilacus subsp. altitudinum]
MNVIIIEDEKPAARLLQRKLQKLGVEANMMLHSVEESVTWFSNNRHPDLIFLDIQLSDGLSFEIFEAIQINSAVIFTTAYDEYALRAFKLNSIDYLLKPIDEDDLEMAISKYREHRPQPQNLSLDFEQIKRMLVNPIEKSYKKRFTIKMGQRLKVVNVEDAECFFSENKGTYIHTKDNRDYLLECTLEQLESELDPEKFYRVSRKHIVNIDAINDIVVYTNSRLKVIFPSYNEDEVIVSRERVSDFRQWLGN